MKKILFLASGGGGTMKFLHHAIKEMKIDFKITGVIANKECGAIEYARNFGIENEIVKIQKSDFSGLIHAINKYDADIIVTNINRILPKEVLNCTSADFINLHCSILPAFAGLMGMQTVEQAKKQNCQFLGATCHEVNETVDAGRIICQAIKSVNCDEPTEKIYDDVFQAGCIVFLNSLLLKYNCINNFSSADKDFNGILAHPNYVFSTDKFTENFWNKIRFSDKNNDINHKTIYGGVFSRYKLSVLLYKCSCRSVRRAI